MRIVISGHLFLPTEKDVRMVMIVICVMMELAHQAAGDAQSDPGVPHSPQPKARQDYHLPQRSTRLALSKNNMIGVCGKVYCAYNVLIVYSEFTRNNFDQYSSKHLNPYLAGMCGAG